MCAWHPHRERLVLADFREVVVVNGVVRLEFRRPVMMDEEAFAMILEDTRAA
jgi:hypothetical protein